MSYTNHLSQLPIESLRNEVEAMAKGPGAEPIEGRDLEAQVAYHLAIVREQPFLSFTKQQGVHLGGEITIAKSARLRHGNDSISAKVAEGKWTAEVPSTWMDGKPVVVSTASKREIQLDLSKSATSHHRS